MDDKKLAKILLDRIEIYNNYNPSEFQQSNLYCDLVKYLLTQYPYELTQSKKGKYRIDVLKKYFKNIIRGKIPEYNGKNNTRLDDIE